MDMNLIELVDKRNQKLKDLDVLLKNAKGEKRKFNNEEDIMFNKLSSEIIEFNNKINDIKAEDNAIKIVNKKNNRKTMNEKFSLLKSIKDIVDNNAMSDETREMLNAGKNVFRNAGITPRGQIILPFEERTAVSDASTAGQEVIAEDKMNLLVGLKAKTILGQAGATFYNGLVGDVSIPVYTATSSSWATETGAASDGAGTFSEVTLSPHRLTTYIDLSKQFLAQDSISSEATLMQEMIDSILVKVENTAFDASSGATRPNGLFYGASYAGTLSGATSWAKVIGMKAAVDANNALTGNLAYVTTPALAGTFETTSTDSGSGIFIMQDGKIGGYPVLVSSNVNAGKAAFGNWADYVVGNWGGMDITVDPYSQAVNGKVRVIINTYWDFKTRRSTSFKLNQLS